MESNYGLTTPICVSSFSGGPQLTQVCPASTTAATFIGLFSTLIQISPKIGDPCGRIRPVEKPSTIYDFVVVGGGAAGAAVAARLSEVPEWKILLLEAGPDEPAGAEIPANFGVFLGSSIDWQYKTSNESHACLKYNGTCKWPRGKNLGGTTVHHGMAYHRGHAKDYTNWVEMGNEGWSWIDVLPFFVKSEDNREIGRVSAQYHGTGGVMTVERFPWQPAFAHAILAAANETGYGTTEDMVGEKITGFNIAQTMSKDGVRQSSAAAYLRPLKDRKNLHIALNATATKIVTRNEKVREVEYVMNGKLRSVKVKREVVISGGAVNSPQLLLLSGIGPADELKALGIPVVLDLPGVGKNLHNHVSYGIDFTVPDPRLTSYNMQDVNEYMLNQTGPLSSSGLAQLTAILQSSYTTPDHPDIQIFFSGYQESCLFDSAVDVQVQGTDTPIRFSAVNLHTKSRGAVTLVSKDPLAHPIIWSNDLDDPQDIEIVLEGIHILQRIANSSAMQALGLTLAPGQVTDCSKHEFHSDDYFRCAMKYDTRTENHQAGSCKMGPDTDPLAVVDPQLRVHGIEGLRVADASIMPRMISGNPHASITMIGERAADFIKKTYNKCSYS